MRRRSVGAQAALGGKSITYTTSMLIEVVAQSGDHGEVVWTTWKILYNSRTSL